MSFDSIITLLCLLIAGWAIIPDSKRLIFQLRITFIDKVIGGFFFILIIYLLYYDSFKIYGYVPHFGFYKIGITSSNIIFILLLLFGIIAWIRFKYIKYFPSSNIKDFEKLVNNLLQEKKYNDLTNILNEYFNKVCMKAYGKDYKDIGIKFERKPDSDTKYIRDIIKRIILNEPFIEYLVKNQSYLVADFFDIYNFRYSYSHMLLEKLLNYKQSILYYELKNIHFDIENNKYIHQSENKLFNYILSDLNLLYNLELWMPFNQMAIKELQNRVIDKNHYILDDISISECDVILKIYDILLRNAIEKKIDILSLAIYYFIIVEHIIDNYKIYKSEMKNVDIYLKNIYEKYLEKIFLTFGEWLELINNITIPSEYYDIPIIHEFNPSIIGIRIVIEKSLNDFISARVFDERYIGFRLKNIIEQYVMAIHLNQKAQIEMIEEILFSLDIENKDYIEYCSIILKIINDICNDKWNKSYLIEYNAIIEKTKEYMNKKK